MLAELIPLIILGFGLGMMHALDADHVMAVSSLSNQKPDLFRTLCFSANWALGHATILVFSGLCLFGLGLAIPESLQKIAEAGVGLFLIVLGILCFIQFRKEKISLNIHRHGEIEHCHWQTESHSQKNDEKNSKSKHLPVLVGGLHGLAGSAPALALLPAVGQGEILVALSYLVVFSLGVMFSMVLFGLGFGYFQNVLKHRYNSIFHWSRRVIATASILLGSFWLIHAV